MAGLLATEPTRHSVWALAATALRLELDLTPKPGLVDRKNSGSHDNMDRALFLRSIDAIAPWFRIFEEVGVEHAHTPSHVPPGCDGLMTVLDWLTNPWEPYKRGIMIGFTATMDYAWIYRSILESIALTLKNNYDSMTCEMQQRAKQVIITGGGSNSDLFMQIFADVFNMPARRNTINGCASLGAAINTAVGLGLYPSYQHAVDNMVRVKDIFTPVAVHAARYAAMNKGIFKDLTKHTDPILKKSYEVFHGDLSQVDAIQSWSNA